MAKKQIPVVTEGSVRFPCGKAFNLASPEGSEWLKGATSFRYESCGRSPFTAQKKPARGIDYWYGSRKVRGKLYQKFIGRAGIVDIERLESTAKWLDAAGSDSVGCGDSSVPNLVGCSDSQKGEADRISALESRVQKLEATIARLGKCFE